MGLTLSASLMIGILVVSAMAVGRTIVLRGEEASLKSLSESLSSRTEGFFRQLSYAFTTFELWLLAHPQADPRFDPEFAGYISAFEASLRDLVDLRIVSKDGDLYELPAATAHSFTNVSDRQYFLAQRNPRTQGFVIGEAIRDRLTGHWSIPVSYHLAKVGGDYDVLVAFIDLERLLDVYTNFLPPHGGTLALLRQDGRILAGLPFDEKDFARTIAIPAELKRLVAETQGDAVSKTGKGPRGEPVLRAFHSLGFPNLAVVLTANTQTSLRIWRQSIPPLALGALVFIGFLVFIATRLFTLLEELGESRKRLEESVRSLEENRATKDKLFSIISHDLRSPIGGMRSLLETLAKERRNMSEEDLAESLGALAEAADSTFRLLEDLLSWSKSQRENLIFRPQTMALAPLVDETLEYLAAMAATKGLSFRKAIEEGCPVYADEDMMSTILRNLLSNAVKYSHMGGRILVEARIEKGYTILGVRDEGEGMDDETRRRLFSDSGLASRPGTAGERGTGLGLQVVKEFVDRHGGRIEVLSNPSEGALFEVYLPLAAAPA